jgi:hypothetical protein
MWQDQVLTVINFCFILTLVPAVLKNYRYKDVESQSILTYSATAVLLSLMCFIFWTLNLTLSSIATGGTALVWYILTYQKIKYS